jgi:hypothetical protein
MVAYDRMMLECVVKSLSCPSELITGTFYTFITKMYVLWCEGSRVNGGSFRVIQIQSQVHSIIHLGNHLNPVTGTQHKYTREII